MNLLKGNSVYCFQSGDNIYYTTLGKIKYYSKDVYVPAVVLEEPIDDNKEDIFEQLRKVTPEIAEKLENQLYVISLYGVNHVIPTIGNGSRYSVYDGVDIEYYNKLALDLLSRITYLDKGIYYVDGYEIHVLDDDILFYITLPDEAA